MEKKYQVFVSSTYQDLIEERQKVIEALLGKNCFPVGMEYFPAANDDQFTVIKKLIDRCDYYILIIALWLNRSKTEYINKNSTSQSNCKMLSTN